MPTKWPWYSATPGSRISFKVIVMRTLDFYINRRTPLWKNIHFFRILPTIKVRGYIVIYPHCIAHYHITVVSLSYRRSLRLLWHQGYMQQHCQPAPGEEVGTTKDSSPERRQNQWKWKSLVVVYTTVKRELLWEWSVLPKKTAQWPPGQGSNLNRSIRSTVRYLTVIIPPNKPHKIRITYRKPD